MDTNDLKIFLTYAGTENLRAAAEFHRTTHIQIIRSLRRLEGNLGIKLTRRVGRGSALSTEGRRILEQAERLLKEEATLIKTAIGGESRTRPVRIVTFEIFSTHLAPEINHAVGQGRPVDWIERVPGQIEQLILADKADFGISYMPIPTAGIEHLKIGAIRMGVYQSKTRPFKGVPFAKIPFVIPIQDEFATPTKSKGLDGWPDDRVPRKILYRVALLESALAMADSGQCIGYFPRFVVERFNRASGSERLVPLGDSSQESTVQDVYLVTRKGETEGQELRSVARLLRSLK